MAGLVYTLHSSFYKSLTGNCLLHNTVPLNLRTKGNAQKHHQKLRQLFMCTSPLLLPYIVYISRRSYSAANKSNSTLMPVQDTFTPASPAAISYMYRVSLSYNGVSCNPYPFDNNKTSKKP